MPATLADRIQVANRLVMVRGEVDAIADCFAGHYVAHLTGKTLRGHAGIRRVVGMVRKAFPKLAMQVEILAETDDRVAWQRTMTARQAGSYAGFPASNAEVTWRDMVVSRFEGGMIAEEWVISDLAEQLLRARKR